MLAIAVAVALGAMLVIAGVAAGFAYWQVRTIVDQFQAGPKRAVVQQARLQLKVEPRRQPGLASRRVEEAHGTQTLLLIGSDHRYTTGSSSRSDTIILVRLDATRHRVALLSIPRDLYVPIDALGQGRINAAFAYGGGALLIRTVREVFGVKIDHFVEVDFAGFRHLVDTLGGIYLPIGERYYNRNLGTPDTNYANIDLQPGYQHLNGAQALAFARYRHTDSDFYRAARQQLFLHVMLQGLLSFTYNPLALRARALAFAQATTSDISSLHELWWILTVLRSVPRTDFSHATLQAQELMLNGTDYVQATTQETRAAVDAFYGTSNPLNKTNAPRHSRFAASEPRPLESAPVVPDAGTGRSILAAMPPIRRCNPTGLPPGFWWPTSSAARSYVLDGHPAIAAYATAGSGRSILWMWTTWHNPPILQAPTATIRREGHAYLLWTDSGRIHQIAWSIGATQVWITNTLRDELTSPQMLGLALSCARSEPPRT